MNLTDWKNKLARRPVLWIGIPALLILVVVAVGMGRRKDATYFTARVEKGDVLSVVQATGTINAVTSVQVGSQVSGMIQKLNVDFNSRVKKGQVIAQIEPSVFKARYDQAVADRQNAEASRKSLEVQVDVQKADVASSKANVDKARAAAVQARLDYSRAEDLFKQGIVAEQQRDSAQATFDSAQAGLNAAQAQLEQSQARLKASLANVEQARAQVAQRKAAESAARVDLEHATIYAPIDGTVVARNVDVGQTVAASLQAPTLFTIAEDLSKMLVYVKTDESDVGNVKVGARSSFKVDAFPRDTFFGRVKQIRMNPTTVQNVVTYDTIIEFDNPEEKLLPGMTAYVTIPVAAARDVLKIPNGALRFRPEISDEERKALLQRAGIEMPGAGRGSRGMAPETRGRGSGDGGQETAGSSPAPGPRPPAPARGEGGRESLGGGQGAGRAGGMAGGGPTETQIVWKLSPDKQLQPVLVKTSITDYTFTAVTEVLKGQLNESEQVVTGMAIPTRASQGQFGGQRPPGAMGGPGGMRPFGKR